LYGKVFESIYEGSLYGQWEAIVTMQQLVVLADRDGVVDMTPQAISGKTSIPLEIIEKGLEILSRPDPLSRTDVMDGVRIALLEDHRTWGWYLVNHKKYRDMRSAEDRKAYMRNYMKQKRALTDVNTCKQPLALLANTDTDTDTYKEHTSSSDAVTVAKAPPCPHDKIIDLYHKHCVDLPRVRVWEGARRKDLSARFRKYNNLEWWEWFFQTIHTLDFYNGRERGKTWKANLAWIVKLANFQKLMDACYDKT